jgi:hypothetical protein
VRHILNQVIDEDELVAGEGERSVVNGKIVDRLARSLVKVQSQIQEHVPLPLAYKCFVALLLCLASRSRRL